MKLSYFLEFYRQIIWENRLMADGMMDDVGNKCKITVNGVDCMAEGTFIGIYSHKFKKQLSDTSWESASERVTRLDPWPFPAGDWNDLNISLNAIKCYLLPGECVEADDGNKAKDPAAVRAHSAVRFMGDKHWHMERSKRPEGGTRPSSSTAC
jgi:hypothetical protein